MVSEGSQKQVTFRSLNVEQGLSQNSVVSIAQDSTGYLWLATQDGLNRYDGKTFKYYNKRFADITRPTFSRLGKVYVDREDQLWIITLSGVLEKYDRERDTFIIQSKFKNVSAIYQDSDRNHVIGTFGDGIHKIDRARNDTIHLYQDAATSFNVFSFYSDADASYALTSSGRIRLGKDDYVLQNESLPISSVARDTSGKTWLGTYGKGLYIQEESQVISTPFLGFNANNTLPDKLNIQALLIDSHNRLWVGTYGDGAYVIDTSNRTVRHFMTQKSNPFALHYNDVLCLYEDYTGTIWFGTDGAGLSYYDENLLKFNILTNNQTPNDVNVDVIRAIAVDASRIIWLGTSGKGLTSYNTASNIFKTFTTTNSQISSNRVMSLLKDDTDLWIGFQGSGLNILNDSGKFNRFDALRNHTVWKIYKDSKNRIWLCTRDHGLLQFDKYKGIIDQFNTDNSALTSNNIRTIEEGDNGELWLGMEFGGLFKLNPEKKEISSITEIKDNIKSLYQASDGILWIGTNGNGLKAYHSVTRMIKTYSREDGLPNNVIYSILPDNNDLWLSSNRGISKVTVRDDTGLDIINYNNYDGLQALEFNTGAYYKDEKDFLYFGGLNGLNWFKPGALTKNPTAPKTVINGLQLFSEEHSMLPDHKFDHNQNTLTFSFAGLHYSLPERNRYKYRLLPYDEDWIEVSTTNLAHYPKLPADDYRFEVTSSNYDNVWNDQPVSYTFTIRAPWYFNRTSKVVYIALLLLTGFLVYRYLKWRWHMKMQLQLEHNETERLKKLDEFKSKLYTNISHEFRTPLTLISGPIDKQLSKPDLKEQDKKELSLVQRSAKRMLNLVNQMLDLSKLESGSLKLSVTNGDLGALLKQIAAAFEYKAEEKNIDFTSKLISLDDAWFDKDVIEKILTNLLTNALKYAPVNGKVHFEIALQDGQMIITVINNGNTITDEELGKLFQRYYQADKSSDGVGIGLSLVKELSLLSHGNIVAHTMNEDDIQFTVTLPVERSYYNQSEIVFKEQVPADGLVESAGIEDHVDLIDLSEETPVLLIIEDDTELRDFIKSIFENDYNIVEAPNGKEGIEKALLFIPDLIISDIMMPLADGIEVCNTLKHDEKTSHIPIILLTAKVGAKNEIKGLKTGADDYITKPFNSDKLQIRVQKLIELRRQLQKRYSNELEFDTNVLAVTSVESEFLKRLQEVLDDSLTDPDFNSEALGEKMLLSRMQLHRKLKALTGLSASEFLRSQRLKMAVKYLKESDLTVSEVAYQVGFNTPSYFIKCFKTEFNCTPNEYLSRA